MGRHRSWKLPKITIKSMTKEEKIAMEEALERNKILALPDKEKMVSKFLANHAIAVLEATGRGMVISHREYALELLKKLEEEK